MKKNIFFKIFFSIIIIIVFLYYFVIIFKKYKENIENEVRKENYKNFEKYVSSNDLKKNLSDIFKYGDLDLKEYPNVEVTNDADFFKTNKFLPECCLYYSDYSSDKGCPCITPEQQFFLQRRGGNRNINSFVNGETSVNLYFSPTNALLNRQDKIFNDFKKEPSYIRPQNEEERKNILKNYFNIQDR